MKPCIQSTPRFRHRQAALALAVLFAAQSAHAQNFWTGASDGNITTGSNWSPNVTNFNPNAGLTFRFNGNDTTTIDLTLSSAIGGNAGFSGSQIDVTSSQTNSLVITGSAGASVRLGNSSLSIASGAGAVTFAGVGGFTIGGLTGNTTHTIANNSSNLLDLGNWTLGPGGGGNRTVSVNGSGNVTSNGAWSGTSGTLALNKSGAGTLTLGGNNTFSGATALSAGNLVLTNGLALQNSALTISGTGNLSFSGITSATIGGLTSSVNLSTIPGSGSLTALTFNPGNGIVSNYSGNITGAAGLSVTKSGGGNQTLSGSNSYTGATTISGGTLRLGSVNSLGDGTNNTSGVTVSGSATLDFVGFSPTANVPLTMNSSANANDVGALNNSGGAVSYSGSLELKRATIIGTGNFDFTGGFTGGGFTLNKNGTGTFAITNGGNTTLGLLQVNRGGIQVNAGTGLSVTSMNIGSGSSVGGSLIVNGGSITNSGNTSVGTGASSGGTLTVNSGTLNNSGIIQFGTGTGTASGTLTLNGGTLITAGLVKGSLTFNANFNGGTLKANGASSTFFAAATAAKIQSGGAVIDDSGFAITIAQSFTEDNSTGGGFTKSGVGTVTLTGANRYTGSTFINEGTVQAGNAAALGFGGPQKTTTGITTIASGATLDLNGNTINEPITINGTGVGGNGALINSSTTPAIIGSGLAGIQLQTGTTGTGYSTAPAVTINGTGSGATATATLGVTAASFTGFSGGNKTYTVAPTVTISGGGGSGATATAILSGGTTGTLVGFTITNPGSGFTSTPTITFGQGTFSSGTVNGSATPNATNFTVSGVSITAAGSGYTGTPTYTFGSGDAVAGSTVLSSVVLAANSSAGGSGDITINAVVSESGGARALTKVGAGTLTLTASNTYSGGTTITGGLVNFSDVSNFGSGDITLDGGGLQWATSYAGGDISTRTISIAGGNGTFNTNGNNITLANAIGNGGSGQLIKTGAGNLTISSLSSSGGTSVQQGSLNIGSGGASGNIATSSGTTTNFGGTSNYSNTISGAGNVAINSGTVTFSGNNTYTGQTNVTGGKLIVNGSLANTAVTVGSGATLGGSGIIGGSTTVQSGGTLSPGNSPGLETFTSGLTLETGSTFIFELNSNTAALIDRGVTSGFDGVDVTGGTFTLQSGVNFNIVLNGSGSTTDFADAFWTTNHDWLVFDNANSPTVAGSFVLGTISADSTAAAFGSAETAGGTFSFTQTGNDIYLTYTAIPEPSTFAALTSFGVLGLTLYRRRKSTIRK